MLLNEMATINATKCQNLVFNIDSLSLEFFNDYWPRKEKVLHSNIKVNVWYNSSIIYIQFKTTVSWNRKKKCYVNLEQKDRVLSKYQLIYRYYSDHTNTIYLT